MREIRVFVSSPADVAHERQRAERVIERLNGQYAGVLRLIPIRWERRFYEARASFQAQIPEAASCDLVVGILWSRLGSELPADMPSMPNGDPYPSGTAYEVLTAIEQSKETGRPSVYLFRKTAATILPVEDAAKQALVVDQLERLKRFWERFVRTREGQFKAGYQEFITPDQFEAELEALLRDWLDERVLKSRALVWPIQTKGSPFRGLAAFGAKHAPVFFGRGAHITRAVEALKDGAERRHPFLLLIGSSGSGKSSLAYAGLAPRLTTPGVIGSVDCWRVAALRPGEAASAPTLILARHLFDGLKDVPLEEEGRPEALPELAESPHNTPERLSRSLTSGDAASVVWSLNKVAVKIREDQGYDREVDARLLLIVDQLDELFAADISETERNAFAKALATLVETGWVWVIVTLRTDLYERLQQTPDLLALKQNGASYDVAPPGAAELAEIVRKPAEATGLTFERDEERRRSLDEQLLEDADRSDMLPLLQFALQELFVRCERRGERTLLTFASYSEMGGLDGAINKRGEAAMDGLGQDEHAALPRLLRQLVVSAREEDGTARTIRTVPFADAAPDEPSKRLVQALVDARILLSGEKSAGVRLAHERVLKSWARASEIVRANATFYRIRDDVDDQLRRWQEANRIGALLIPKGVPLAEAESIAKRYPGELPSNVLAFIAASRRRANRGLILTGVAAASFATIAGVAAWQWRVAEIERDYAERHFEAAKNAVDGLNGLIYGVAQGLQNVAGIRVETVKNTLSALGETLRKLNESAPGDAQLMFSRARMLNNFVDAYLASGATREAEKAAEDGLQTAQAMRAKEPGDQQAQTILAISLYKLGDVKLKQTRAGDSLTLYQQSFDIARDLAKQHPSYATQRLLWVATDKVGDAKLASGDVSGALAAFRGAVALARSRAEADARNLEAARDYSISLAMLGAVRKADKDYDAALSAYGNSLDIRRKLAAEHTGNALARRDVALSLNDIGYTKLEAGDPHGALAAFDESVAIFRALAQEDPSNARAHRDVAVALNNAGDLKLEQNDRDGALKAYADSVGFLRPLVALDESDIPAKIELAGALTKLAGVSGDAVALYNEALSILKPLKEAGQLDEKQSGWIELIEAQLASLPKDR